MSLSSDNRLPDEGQQIMHTPESIHRVGQILAPRSIIKLPEGPGVYAFWWVGRGF
jgi:hypothetical protein